MATKERCSVERVKGYGKGWSCGLETVKEKGKSVNFRVVLNDLLRYIRTGILVGKRNNLKETGSVVESLFKFFKLHRELKGNL